MKKFFQKYLFFTRSWWHSFLVFKNKIYFKTHKSLKKWFIRKYKKNFKRKPNFDNPVLFSEKLYVQMMSFDHELGSTLVDKIAVKDYLSSNGFGKYVTPTIKVFKNSKEIDFSSLPNEFVIKCNHDSGSTFLVNQLENSIKDRDGRRYTFKKMKKYLKKSLKTSMYFQGFEKQYENVKPAILAEELIKVPDDEFLSDYKIFCSKGKPVFAFLVVGRSNKGEKTLFVDKDFNLIYSPQPEYRENYKQFKPLAFDEMVRVACEISKEFGMARVDLYYTKSLGIRFGEIAFSHYGGTNTGTSYPDYQNDLLIGGMFDNI